MSPFVFFLVAGIILISIEVLVFQMAVLWTLFIGFGALVAAFAAWMDPEATWLLTTGVFVVASTLISLLLYKPLQNWQHQPSLMPGSDALGQEVQAIQSIAPGKKGKVKWSGAEWKATLEADSDPVEVGDSATITKLEGIRLTIKKA